MPSDKGRSLLFRNAMTPCLAADGRDPRRACSTGSRHRYGFVPIATERLTCGPGPTQVPPAVASRTQAFSQGGSDVPRPALILFLTSFRHARIRAATGGSASARDINGHPREKVRSRSFSCPSRSRNPACSAAGGMRTQPSDRVRSPRSEPIAPQLGFRSGWRCRGTSDRPMVPSGGRLHMGTCARMWPEYSGDCMERERRGARRRAASLDPSWTPVAPSRGEPRR